MSFSFRYKQVRLKNNQTVYRPLIPFTLCGKERLSLFGMIDSGSDVSIIPKEIAEILDIEIERENEVFGIDRNPIKSKEGKIMIEFGKGREVYSFLMPVLVPDIDNAPVIIGRHGFFERFKICFIESDKKIEFKRV